MDVRSLLLSSALVTCVALSPASLNAQGTMRRPQPATEQNPNTQAGQNPNSTQSDSGSNTMMKSGDARFAMKAAQGGMAEVQLGQLAAQKANNPDVKAFGQMMVDDHTKANDQLKAVASKENMSLPTTLDAKDQSLYNKLEKMSGADFDRAYVKAMVKDHQEDVKEFQKEAEKGKDPQIKNFASEALPVLQKHLSRAQQLEGSVASGSASGAASRSAASGGSAGASGTGSASSPQ